MRALIVFFSLAFAVSAARGAPSVDAPDNMCNGCAHPVSWSGIAAPSVNDWVALYAVGAPDSAYLAWRFITGAASGSVSFSVPSSVAFGAYEIRLFSNYSWTRLATSDPSYVSPTVSGTVTNGGAGLSGVSIARDGTACATTSGTGTYTCFVPAGWSGSLTASRGGFLFAPASLSLSNVTTHLTAQNFATTAAPQVSGTVTSGGSPLANVAFGAPGGGSCSASNASGQYTCAVPSGWSGTVTPALSGYVLSPASQSYSNVTANQTAQNYSALGSLQVSGTATLNGLALPNVAFAATNGASCTNSDASGQYSCAVPAGWTGAVMPSASGYSFSPASRAYTNVTTAQSSETYAATLVTTTAPIYFVHVDHLNTPREIYDASQQLRWRWEQQEPFGVNVPDENPSSLGVFEFAFRFPGQYFDRETNLHYNYLRDCYDPATGRFCQPDPIGAVLFKDKAFRNLGGIGLVQPQLGDDLLSDKPKYNHLYGYVRSNPLSFADPLGLLANSCVPQATPPDMTMASDDFCRKRLDYCITFCGYELGMPGRFDNFGPFRACIRRCMNAVGCPY
jgi:RHS repeat-associated protein